MKKGEENDKKRMNTETAERWRTKQMKYVATGVREGEEKERGKLVPPVLGWYYGTMGECEWVADSERDVGGEMSFQSGRGRGTRVRSSLDSAAMAREETEDSLVCKTKSPSRRSRA